METLSHLWKEVNTLVPDEPRQLRPYQLEAVTAVTDAWNSGNTRPSVVLPTGSGKPLSDDTDIPTPNGFKKMGELVVGDEVIGSDGNPARVAAVEPQGVIDLFVVSFSDGASVLAGEGHLWTVHGRRGRSRTVTTKWLADKPSGTWHVSSIASPAPCAAHNESDMLERSPEFRVKYVNGVLSVSADKGPMFGVDDYRDAATAYEMAWSVGVGARIESVYGNGLHVGYRVVRQHRSLRRRGYHRSVVSVVPSRKGSATCIQVDREDGLFAATRAYVLTHNSTVIAKLSTEARKEGKRVLLLAHRKELLEQMAASVGYVDPDGEEVGVVAADRSEDHTNIVAASFQTLARSPQRLAALGKRDIILADECFPAGTQLLDGRTIESINVGDYVWSWDVNRSCMVSRRVMHTFKNPVKALARVVFENGDSVVTTYGHPFLVDDMRTWIPAAELTGKLVVVSNGVPFLRRRRAPHRYVDADPLRASGYHLQLVARVEMVDADTSTCPDGYVYNIEVDDTNTYILGNGIVVHNCHHITAPTYINVLENLGALDDNSGVRSCGFTATMYRDDGRALGDVWKDVVYEKDLIWAINGGFLIKPRGKTVALPELNKLSSIKTVAGDYKKNDLDEVMSASVDSTVDAILRHAPNAAMIVFATSVDHAALLADKLTAAGIPARDVTGAHKTDYREMAYSDFRSGALNALVTVQVLTEGADFPRCDTVVLARPTRSKVLFAQIVGRAVRPYTDPVTGVAKTDATVLDLTGVVRDVKLASLTDLVPETKTQVFNSDGEDMTEDDEFMEEYLPAPKKKKEREGRLDLEDIDLMESVLTHRRRAVWLQTGAMNQYGDDIAFMPMKNNDKEYVFLYPPVNRIGSDMVMLGMYSDTSKQVSFIMGPDGTPATGTVVQAMSAAEEIVGKSGYVAKTAGWRRREIKASDAQKRLAHNLKIPGYHGMSRGELSDALTSHFARKRLLNVLVACPLSGDVPSVNVVT